MDASEVSKEDRNMRARFEKRLLMGQSLAERRPAVEPGQMVRSTGPTPGQLDDEAPS